MSCALEWGPLVAYIHNALTLDCFWDACKVWPCSSRTTNTKQYSEHSTISYSEKSIPSEWMLHLEIINNSLCPLYFADL